MRLAEHPREGEKTARWIWFGDGSVAALDRAKQPLWALQVQNKQTPNKRRRLHPITMHLEGASGNWWWQPHGSGDCLIR